MPGTGIEPAALRSLTRHSNQLSCAAAQHYHYLLYVQTICDKNVHNRKLSFVAHLHNIVAVCFQKWSIFYFKIAKSRSAAGGSAPKPLVWYCSHTPLLKNTRRLSCMFLNEFTKLCDQFYFSYLKIQIV